MTKFEKSLMEAVKKAMYKNEVSFFARVVSYDKESMTAEILPLLKTEQQTSNDNIIKKEYQSIKNIRVDMEPGVRPIYEKDDIVKCVISASPIEEPIETGRPSNTLKHKFDLSFCTIKGKVKERSFTAPDHYGSEDGLILSDDPNFYIAFRSDQNYIKGKTVIDGLEEVNGDTRSLVTYTELLTEISSIVGQINTALALKQDSPGAAGTITFDLSAAKTDNIKTGPG